MVAGLFIRSTGGHRSSGLVNRTSYLRYAQATLLAGLALLWLPAALAADVSSTWLGGDANWSDGTQWTTAPVFPNNVNGLTYDATISAGSVGLDQDITVQRLILAGGEVVAGTSALTLNEGLVMTDGRFAGSFPPDPMTMGTLNLVSGSTSTVSGGAFGPGWTVNNSGAMNMTSSSLGEATVNNLAGGIWNVTLPQFGSWNGSHFNNAGALVANGDFNAGTGTTFNNTGTITGSSDSLFFLGNGFGTSSGSIDVGHFFVADEDFSLADGATLTANLFSYELGNLDADGAVTINSDLDLSDLGILRIHSGATAAINGTITVHNTSGFLAGANVNGTLTSSHAIESAGRLSGSGTVNAGVSSSGFINPGGTDSWNFGFHDSPARLTINGDVSLLSGSRIVMEIGGLMQGTQFDHLVVKGQLSLGGELELQMRDGFESQLLPNQVFTIVSSDHSLLGAFTNIANGDRLITSDGKASFEVNYGATSPFGAKDIVLSNPIILIPEPTDLLLWGEAAAAGVLVAVRRKSRSGITRY